MFNLENLPESPVTQSGKVKIVETFDAAEIAALYRRQENLNIENYFAHGDTIYLLECEDTGYRFYYPFEIIGDQAFYENLQVESDKKGDGYDREWAEDHKFAAGQIGKDAKLLEIGCGSGKFLAQISEITKNVGGLELNSIAAESARRKGFDVQVEFIEDFCEKNPAGYDVVCAFQVLEHIAAIKPFIDSALKLLKPGGKLIFSVPNNEPYFQRFSKYEVLNLPPHHMGLWNLESFRKLEKFFPMSLTDFEFTGESGVLADAYLRAKAMAKIKSLPTEHSTADKLKIYGIAPVALLKSSLDYISGKKNCGHISVVFSKK